MENVERSERMNKKYKIVIFGPVEEPHTSVEGVCNKLPSLLDTDIKTQDFNNLYKLEITDKSPVKV